MESIGFECQVARIQTMADGGLRFTFDTGEQYVKQAAQLMECKRFSAWLKVSIEPTFREKTIGAEQNQSPGRTKAKRRVQQGDSGV